MTDTEAHKKINGTIIDHDTFDNMFKKMECKAFLSEEDIEDMKATIGWLDLKEKKFKRAFDGIEYTLIEVPWHECEDKPPENEREIF